VDLIRFSAGEAFYLRAERFLLQHEACHNLILGLSAGMLNRARSPEASPYLAVVQDAGAIVAAALMTPPYNLVLSRARAERALECIAADVCAADRVPPGVLGPIPESERFASIWKRQTGQPFRKARAQRIYQVDEVRPPRGVPGAMRRATDGDRPLLVRWFLAFAQEALGEDNRASVDQRVEGFLRGPGRGLYVWEDPEPVSMAGHAGPTPNGIRVSAVYTPPERRNRGYASACVAALSQMLLDGGRRFCFLFTDLANPTSNRIYQQIGYRAVCDVDEFKFA
jgi:uncharacterized protein